MKFVAILSLAIVAAADSNGCMAYECDPSGVVWTSGTCAMFNATANSTRYDLKSDACSSDWPCQLTLLSTAQTITNVTCMTPKTPTGAQIAYPGENCDTLNLCYYGTCTAGICSTTTSPCANTYDCGLGNTCDTATGKCVTFVAAGAKGCTVDTDCVNNAGCDIATGGAAGNGTCVQYFSVTADQPVQACTATTTVPGTHSLCASGYCYGTASPFKCTGAFKSATTPPIRVTASTSTCTSAADASSNLTQTIVAECGYDGFPYCPLFFGDAEYTDYFSDINSFLSSPNLAKCNTIRHPTGYFDITKYHWCAQNLTTTETYHYYRATIYPEVVMASSCVIKIMAPQYYQAESASSLVLGALLLALIQ